MALNAQELAKLKRIVSLAEKLIETDKNGKSNGAVKQTRTGKRIRRSGQDLVRFRRMLKTQRKKGVPVVELARKHGISSAYIYTLP